ncbi:FAD-dependent oxidoreductase (plasmid) [Brucella anthropi]|uniref:flavin monoamine oxidase family protein n=1 Tax=Brucella anthropi TaxID=529 RepID=UPI00188B4E01|nr:NAD(P)/FAD-dependent oxidoreductase [Brucella anthropi]QPA29865.1 FAD-dependent oxidoreductase [Brucella anthropi]
MKVLVAGAGLSGLNAAWELHKKGHEVTVFESAGRVGGRCWSEALPNGEIIEYGGEFIDVNDHTIRRIAAEFRLPLVTLGIPFDRRWQVDGSIMSPEELIQCVDAMADTAHRMEVEKGHHFSLRELARETFGEGYATHRYCQKLFATTTCDPDRVNGYAIAKKYRGRGPLYVEHRSRLLHGNDAIAKEMHRRMGDVIRFNNALVRVIQDRDGVEFTLANNEVVRGDAAVIAVPLPKLKRLIATLDLPHDMQQAIETREMGAAAKLNIAVSGDAPPKGMQTPNGPWWSWSTADPSGTKARGSLTGYAGGWATMRSLGLEESPERWLSEIKAYRTDLEVSDTYIFHNWGTYEHTEGAYSMPGLAWEPEFDNAFNRLAGRIAFAGEHTYQASLNGALESGARAASLLTLTP